MTDPDDIPEPPDEATTKPGDLWLLGDHRLLCGDAGSVADLDRLLDGVQVSLMWGPTMVGYGSFRYISLGSCSAAPHSQRAPR